MASKTYGRVCRRSLSRQEYDTLARSAFRDEKSEDTYRFRRFKISMRPLKEDDGHITVEFRGSLRNLALLLGDVGALTCR